MQRCDAAKTTFTLPHAKLQNMCESQRVSRANAIPPGQKKKKKVGTTKLIRGSEKGFSMPTPPNLKKKEKQRQD
jgi:hypothetical protein